MEFAAITGHRDSQMDAERFRRLIHAADLQGLDGALTSDPGLANRPVPWLLNQCNESDPLHYLCDCVFNGWLDDDRAAAIAVLLLQHGALVEGTQGRESPLIAAASLGAEAVAQRLVESGAKIEATGIFGARPLHWAATLGLPSTVEMLIRNGAEIEAKCVEFGATPLFWAAHGFGPDGPNKKRDPLAAARILIDAGADVDTTNKSGVTALACSQRADTNEMYELLLHHSN